MHFLLATLLTLSVFFPSPSHAMTPAETILITNAAERGSDGAQLLLGIEYLYGDGGKPKDAKLAAHWLELAGEQNNAAAQQMLGDLYERGLGVPRNLTLSAAWRKKAATRGSTDAQFALGKMYLSGEGVEMNPEQAERWLKRAAKKGNFEARILLIKIYQSRTSHLLESREYELEENLLADAALESYQSGVEFMQFMEKTINEFIEVFHEPSINLQKLAEAGDVKSQYRLATQYESGHGEKLDYGKALYWFQKAAKNGNIMAMKSLAHIYEKGIDGVTPDRKTAEYWTEKAKAAQNQ
ncbi:hypothetical protein SCD_n02020 [Sulfuricella denitrificans skB26]|uniref:Sel1 repeat family protein n=1 Tax=Sulfuricella denitrificans (strain DSM 22764 / NBRC 105220 / skB26) TaxID=1163617 RepID=S6AI23_SULDS|nr:tetratricopeptide repeat protein [Sulfuricella denitrificans]BAN35831.1 hypothetical protein SCD_n02020 [Sulfuricella denitrificans skB26]